MTCCGVTRVSGSTDKDKSLVRLGDAIRSMRKAAGLTQEALADAAGIDRSHMGKIERGERNITLLNIIKIAKALGVKCSALLESAGL